MIEFGRGLRVGSILLWWTAFLGTSCGRLVGGVELDTLPTLTVQLERRQAAVRVVEAAGSLAGLRFPRPAISLVGGPTDQLDSVPKLSGL